MLERNAQPRGGEYEGELYRERGGLIMWRAGNNSREYWRPSVPNETGLRRDQNVMDIDRRRERNRIYYVCGKWGYMAKNCWKR